MKKKIIDLTIKAGQCPKCQSKNRTENDIYPEATETSGEYGWEYICDDCGAKYIEWFSLTYIETMVID